MATPLDAFTCAITHEVMTDPVVTADGQSYERAAIERWLTDHDTSPATNQRLPSRALLPNVALKKAIDEHRSARPAHASPTRSRSNEASRRRTLSPDVATRSVRQATHVLTRDQALPETGYFVYRTEGNLDLFKHPSLYDPAVGPNRERLVLPAGELVVVSQREYGRDSNHVFLKLSTENEPALQGLYILEQGRYPPYAPTAIQAIVTKEVAVYRALAATLQYYRPTTSTAGVHTLTDRSVAINSLLATNLHVRDPVTRIEFVRLDNSTLWVPSALLTHLTLRTTRLVVRPKTDLLLLCNLILSSGQTTVLLAGTMAVSSQQATIAGVCYANVTTNNVSGWCKLQPDEFVTSCPPRLAEKSAGLYIPVVILQGPYYLVVVNQVQSDGSVLQSIKYSLPHSMARQIENCTAKGRHVTHAALGPNAEWYISGTKPDGSGGCAWVSKNVPVAFRNVMSTNCRVAFGKYGAYVCDNGTTVYTAGVPIAFRERLATATARPFVSFGLSGESGCFIHDTKGGYMANMSPYFDYDVLDPPPPKRYGRLIALVYSNGEYIKIHENSFTTTGNVPSAMCNELDDFYRRHQRMRNERRQLIKRYNLLATATA